MADLKKSFDDVKEAATGMAGGNLLTSLQKDVNEAMTIEKFENIDTPPETPTTPEPPTPETFVEAETHGAVSNASVGEPLAITSEVQAAGPAPANDVAAPAPDLAKDAKAS
jgi:sec-independent protein translocase protein TatB